MSQFIEYQDKFVQYECEKRDTDRSYLKNKNKNVIIQPILVDYTKRSAASAQSGARSGRFLGTQHRPAWSYRGPTISPMIYVIIMCTLLR